MQDQKPDSFPAFSLSRRKAIGSLTAAVALSGCKANPLSSGRDQAPCTPPPGSGYGRPFDEHTGDPKQLRAILAMWLIIVGNPEWFYIDSSGKMSCRFDDSAKNALANDLQLLSPGGAADVKTIIDSIVATVNDPNSLSSGSVTTTPAGKLGFGWGVMVVQEFLQRIATAPLNGHPTPLYVGGPYCPVDVRTILSLSTDSPTTPTPPLMGTQTVFQQRQRDHK